MPTIALFYGIAIRMYYREHAPPHFHAEYGGAEIEVGIEPIIVLRGHAPPRVVNLVLEWASLHQAELKADWDLCRASRVPMPIAPLE